MITYHLVMNKTEEKPITVQVVDLQDSEVVVSANVTHTPPSGDALTITPSIDTPYINMVFGPFSVVGLHFVKVQAVGNAAAPSKPEVVYSIEVKNY